MRSRARSKVPFERHAVAAAAGVLLEGLLDRVALAYECRVPRKEVPEYDLGDSLNGTSGALKLAVVRRLRH